MESIKELRKRIGITQEEAARATKLSLRSFADYERNDSKKDTPKYRYIIMELKRQFPFDEEHGLLTLDEIRRRCEPILQKHSVQYCIVFGSYAKGYATEKSDVDLLISSDVSGLAYFGMVEELRQALGKKVDALDVKQLKDNLGLTEEILRDGVKIYG